MTRVALLRSGKILAWALTLALALSMMFVAGLNRADAKGHQPANKLAVAGSGVLKSAPDEEVTLLTTTMKNPGSKALVITASLECSILTDLYTAGTDDVSRAEARADVWVEVNDTPVAWADDVAHGRVTFCEREYFRETKMFPEECEPDEPEEGEDPVDKCVIDDFIRTKASHAFTWVLLHDGSGEKTIELKADLHRETGQDGEPDPRANAELVIGARTLTVEPVDVANDETLKDETPPDDNNND